MSKEFLFCDECGYLGTGEDKCNHPVIKITANTTEAAQEKHIPVLEITGNEVEVIVGEVLHPMSEDHYIKYIYLETNKGIKKKELKPNEEASTVFVLDDNEEVLGAYSYCNLHGLWGRKL